MSLDIEEKASKFEEFRPQTPDLSKTLADDDDLNDTDDQQEQVDATARPDPNLRESIYDLKKRIAETKRNYFDGNNDSNCKCFANPWSSTQR